ncbi:MAG: helix-turn-helix domain-containing protein [Nanoarchaeota archaeon]
MEHQTSLELLTIEEAAAFLKTTPKSLYVYLCKSGTNGGTKRPSIPADLYVKIGRKTLFIKDRLIEWLQNGAQMQKGGE